MTIENITISQAREIAALIDGLAGAPDEAQVFED